MTKTETLTYFLFPHLTLSSSDLMNLYIVPPRLRVLEIARPAAIPEWAQERMSGWPVLGSEEISSHVRSCLEGYLDFARVHGGPGGMLGFLNRALDENDEPRYRIQEELRGKCPPDMDPARKEIFQAALFLEIARELDEKELEIESGYDRLNAIEQEFREILGIEDDESERAQANITPVLAPDANGLLYMLPKRIESWFKMLALRPVEGMPVFVACFPEVIEETVEMARSGKNRLFDLRDPRPGQALEKEGNEERSGKQFSAVTYMLGSIPRMDGIDGELFRSIIDALESPAQAPDDHEAPAHKTVHAEPLSSCRHDLEEFIQMAARGQNPAELEGKRHSLQGSLERLFQERRTPEGSKTDLHLTVVTDVSLSGVSSLPASTTNFGASPLVFLRITAGS